MTEVVEVVLGVLLVFFLFLLLYQPQKQPDIRYTEMKLKILNFLKSMDEQGILANLILTNNTQAITDKLQEAFPYITINAWVGAGAPDIHEENVYSIVYFVPGNYTYFKPSKLTVYMWFS